MKDRNQFFYLTSLSRCGLVNTSTPTFPNINLAKTIKNLPVAKYVKNGKYVKSNFRQYQSDRINTKFNCCLKIQSKTNARISIYTLNSLTLALNQIHICCHFSVVAR